MAATIEILTGPAGVGKTGRALKLYREALREAAARLQVGRTIWLTPSRQSGAWVREQLLGDDLIACFNPHVFTFADFADRVLRDSPAAFAPLSQLGRRVLVRRIVQQLSDANKLRYFSSISETRGFIDQVLALISELKRGEVWPEHFEETISSRTDNPRDSELAAIYQAYQDCLHEGNLYDGEGRFWSARDQLSRGHWGPFGDLSLVVVDGFSDFSHTQYEILQLLAGRTEKMLLTLPLESQLRRSDLFAKSVDSLETLKSRLAVKVEPLVDTEASPLRPALQTVCDHLFENPREIVPTDEANGIEILAATGELGEVRSLALAVKELLLAGNSPCDIVVAFRSVGEYAELVDEVFTEAGIPFTCSVSDSLSGAAVIKTLMSVLQVEAEDWPFRRLKGLLDSSYFSPEWPEFEDSQVERDVAVQLRRHKLRGGRQVIIERLEKTSRREMSDEDAPRHRIERARQTRESAARAASLLSRLATVLEPLRRRNTLRVWSETLLRIARELRIDPRTRTPSEAECEREIHDRDTRAFVALEQALFASAALDEQFPGGGRKFPLSEFLKEFTDLLHAATYSRGESAAGKVRIFDAPQVRNLEVPYLFVGGLTESGFPLRRGHDCIYNESERQEFNERGLPLTHRSSHTQDEMMLFYGVVTRARQKLFLSYPAMNASGHSLLPSPYLLALKGLFNPDSLLETHEADLDPVPPQSSMLSMADMRVIAMEQALHKKPGLLGSLWTVPNGERVGRSLLAAAAAADQRFRVHGFTPYEGLISNEKLRSILAKRYSVDHQFSATELENYASCPFSFFMAKVLNVNTLESPDVETDYRRRGNLVHDILTQLHRMFAAELPDDAASADEAMLNSEALSQRFQELVAARLMRHAGDPRLQQALDEIESRLLDEWAGEYGKQWEQYAASMEKATAVKLSPRQFEVAFGAAPGDEAEESGPRHDCLVLGVSHRTVRVRGRIDRVDVGEASGQSVFAIVDYKTGKSDRLSPKQVKEGHAVQLPLYALAAQRLGIVSPEALPLQMGYWFLKETGYKNMLKAGNAGAEGVLVSEDWEALQESLEEYVTKLAAEIRQGNFPVYSSDSDCTKRCPFKMACRVGQIRPLEEVLHKKWSAVDRT